MAAVVAQQYGRAHACRAKLLKLMFRTPPGAGLFSSLLYPLTSASLIQVAHRGAILLIIRKGFLAEQTSLGCQAVANKKRCLLLNNLIIYGASLGVK